MASPEKNFITIGKIAAGIYPNWDLERWLEWPPNMFALISIILEKTGSYRICLMEPTWWDNQDWESQVSDDAKTMLKSTVSLIKMGETKRESYSIEKEIEIIKNNWESFDINDLRTLGDKNKPEPIKCAAVAKALVSILAVIDTCCAFLGFVGQTLDDEKKELKVFKGVANLLLTTTGSLCTFPKFYGTVVPKMRTPQAGIVLRSLSHHLTFHDTEVEVIWRTFPWLHDNKQSLNLMVAPFPKEVDGKDFDIVRDKYHAVRYFKGKIREHILASTERFLNNIVKTVFENAKSNKEVDLLIFPEMSLTENEYRLLLTKFQESNCDNICMQLPIIVAGVLHASKDEEQVHNEVRMAVFFNNKWYELTQRKHHRWQLDKNQISQYEWEGCFPSDRKWFEYCSILQRRLTILTPNAWLGLTALICEDLARQEPVTEVIRGIGPTLLLALLSDGPQLKSRWSARYASVLADDPGTAVLSLTSIGMAKRSKIQGADLEEESKKPKHHTVGLWKDMIRGWKEISIAEDFDVLTFTISAKFQEEYTLDGRSDGINASVFEMNSYNPTPVKFEKYKEKTNNISTTEVKEQITEQFIDHEIVFDKALFGDWHDIRELSALLFAIDAIVDLIHPEKDIVRIREHLGIILPLLTVDENDIPGDSFMSTIRRNVSEAWRSPINSGTSNLPLNDDDKNLKIKEMKEARNEIESIVEAIQVERSSDKDNFFQQLVSVCKARFMETDSNIRTIALAFLYNAHSKLSNSKFVKDLNKSELNIKPNEAMEIRNQIIDILRLTAKDASATQIAE